MLAVCNTNGSQIPRECDAVLYTRAGPEIGVASTKTFLAQIAANYLVGAGIKGIINFAPSRISVPSHIHLEYVDFFHHFYAAAFHIRFAEHQE